MLLGWLWWRREKAPPPFRSEREARSQQTNALREKSSANNPSGISLPLKTTPVSTSPLAPQASIDGGTLTAGPSESASRILQAQLALARQGISPGSLDGTLGPQTGAAVRALQQKENLPATAELDTATASRLVLDALPYTNYVVTSHDVARLQPLGASWLSKSQQERLDYETVLELVGEKSQAHPNLLRFLNPGLNWSNVLAGTTVRILNVEFPPVLEKAAFLRIRLAERILQGFDANTNLLVHFPCSIAQRMDKRPVGELHVAVVAPDPNYTFDPELFPESAEARELGRKLILQPGPNNPVGTVWIGLDRSGYGIHGTPSPEQVGRTESHGCFRLANWNAEYLLKLAWLGMPVFVEP